MRAWQDAGFGSDRAHRLGVAPVDPGAVLHNVAAQNCCFQLLDRGVKVGIGLVFV